MALTLLWTAIAARIEPDVVLCNAAVSACAATGDWQAALALLHRGMVEPNVITYNAAQLKTYGVQWSKLGITMIYQVLLCPSWIDILITPCFDHGKHGTFCEKML